MGTLIGVALFALFFIAMLLGRGQQLREAGKRFDEWIRANGFKVERCETGRTFATGNLVWRVRIVTPAGERREATVRAGMSVREPVEVSWAPPGESVFR